MHEYPVLEGWFLDQAEFVLVSIFKACPGNGAMNSKRQILIILNSQVIR